MDHLKHLKDMMTHRISQLQKQARRLSRMAGASHDLRERRNLRIESQNLIKDAAKIQARYDRLFNQGKIPTNVQYLNPQHNHKRLGV